MDFLSMGLIVTMAGLFVAGLAAVLAIWMERDPNRPPRFAYALTILILTATFVGLAQAYMDAESSAKLEEDIARMLDMLDDLAQNSDDPALADFVASEMNAQSRSNPKIMKRVEKRARAAGKDSDAMLNRNVRGSNRGGAAAGGAAGGAGKSAGKAASAESTGASKARSTDDAGKSDGKSAEGADKGAEGDDAGKSADDKGADATQKSSEGGKSGGKSGGKAGR